MVEEELYEPPAWKDIEELPEYQALDTAKKRAKFLEWDDEARGYAQKTGLWEDKDFRKEYDTNANNIANSFRPNASIASKAWDFLHENDTGIKQLRTARNAIMGGFLEGQRANEIQSRNDPNEVARLSAEAEKYKPSEEFNTFANPNKSGKETWEAFKKDPLGNITQLLAGSFASQATTTIPHLGKIPERMAQTIGVLGAATGVGMAVSPGTAPAVGAAGVAALPIAAAGGLKWGYSEASSLASYANEFAGQYIETLQEHGVDVKDKDALAKAYQNKNLMATARKDAETKGMPVAAWDGVSAVLADNVLREVPAGKGIARGLKIAGKWLGELGIQGLMGGAGEAHSQVALKGTVYDPKAVGLEIGAEFAQGAVDVGVNKATSAIKAVNEDPAERAKATAIQQTSENLAANGAPITARMFAKEGVENLARDNAQTDEQLTEELFDEEEEGDVSVADKTLGDPSTSPATSAIVDANKMAEAAEEPGKLDEAIEFKPEATAAGVATAPTATAAAPALPTNANDYLLSQGHAQTQIDAMGISEKHKLLNAAPGIPSGIKVNAVNSNTGEILYTGGIGTSPVLPAAGMTVRNAFSPGTRQEGTITEVNPDGTVMVSWEGKAPVKLKGGGQLRLPPGTATTAPVTTATAQPAPAVSAEKLDATEATLAPETTFDKLFAKLKTGDLTMNGKRDKMLGDAYLAYMNGDIKKATDLEAWINKKTAEQNAPAAATTKAAEPEPTPTQTQAYTFEAGQNVVVNGSQGATVHKVRPDGQIIVKSESSGKTRYTVVNPIDTKVELVETVKEPQVAPSNAVEITQRLSALPDDVADRISDLPLKDIPAAILAAEQQQPNAKPTTRATTAVSDTTVATPATTAVTKPAATTAATTTAASPTTAKTAAAVEAVAPAPDTTKSDAARAAATTAANKPGPDANKKKTGKVSKPEPARPSKPEAVKQIQGELAKLYETENPTDYQKQRIKKLQQKHKKLTGDFGPEPAAKKAAEKPEEKVSEKAKDSTVESTKADQVQSKRETKAEPVSTKPEPAEKPKTEATKEQEEKVKDEQQKAKPAKPEDKPAKAEQAGRPKPEAKDERVADKTEAVKPVKHKEILHTADAVRIEAPEGATFVRTTDTDGRTAIEPIQQTSKGANPFKEAGPYAKIEAGTKGKHGEFIPVEGEVKVIDRKAEKLAKATTLDTSPDPYQGEPLTSEAPATVDDAGLIDELDSIGALDDDATATSILQNISQNKKYPQWARMLATQLARYTEGLQVVSSYRPDSTWTALYDGNTGRILINTARPLHGAAFSILHEASHHALLKKQSGKTKLNSVETKALADLYNMLEKIQKMPGFQGVYGAWNVAEFTSEMMSNAGFREQLNGINFKGDKFSVFDRAVNAIARFVFGRQVAPGSMLEVAMRNAMDLAGEPVIERNSSTTIAEVLQDVGGRDGFFIAPSAGKAPTKTIKAYKLFRTKDGKLYPLFIGKNKPVETGKWLAAENITTKGFAARPGWHAGVLPTAPHLRTKEGKIAEGRAWAEVEIAADTDWQPMADASKTRDIRDRTPEGGHYRFKTNKMQGGAWIIGGELKVNKILTDEELRDVLVEAGEPEAAEAETRTSALVTAPTTPDVIFNGNANLEARTRAAVNLANGVAPQAAAAPAEVKALTPEQSKLVVDNLDIASKIANNFKNIPLTGYDERQSEARVGLIKAAQAYDPAKNDNFRNYSVRIIKNTLTDLWRKKIRQSKREVSSSVPLGEEGGETIQDQLADKGEAQQPDQGAIDIINKVKNSLSPRDQKILNDFSTGLPLRDVAELHNLSHEGVRKIIRRAGQQIMTELEAAGITDIDNIFPPTEQREPGSRKRAVSAEDEQADTSEQVGKLEAEDIKRTPVDKVLSEVEDPDNPGVYHFPDQTLVAPLAAWHGTKHKIEDRKMTTARIGSGEGTAAFGWGLYSAQRQGVAKGYQETAEGWVVDGETVIPKGNSAEAVALNNVAELGYDGALHGVQTDLDRHNKLEEKKVAAGIKTGKERDRAREGWEETIEEIKKLKGKEVKRNKGNLYKLDITPEDSDLLDWDKSVNDQSDKVKGILRGLGVEVDKPSHNTGEDVYRALLKYAEDPNEPADAIVLTEEQVSKKLEAAGIPGHKFLDRGSRHVRTQEAINADIAYYEKDLASAKKDLEKLKEVEKAPGAVRRVYEEEIYNTELRIAKLKAEKPRTEVTHNYVMYDGKYIEILEENGKPVGTVSEAKPDQSLIAPQSPQGQPVKTPWLKQKKGPYQALGKLTSAGGKWSKELYTALKIKTQKARAAFVNSVMLGNQLEKLYKKHYPNGITKAERATINTALGNIENLYTEEQWKEAEKIEDPAEKAAFLLTAKLENFTEFRKKQAAAFNSLPTEIQEVITEMRNERDVLQRELRNRATTSQELQYSIDDSGGLYIHRSYGIFDDPKGKWVSWVRGNDPEAQRIRAGAERLFLAKARAEMARQLMKDARAAGAPITKADALAQASTMNLSDRVDELMNEYTEVADSGVVDSMRGRMAGQKSMSIMKQRGQIRPEIRALWGEYQDPGENFAKTASSIANFLANDEFLQTVKDEGLARGYLKFKPKDNPNWKRPEGWVQLVGKDAKSMGPLEGAYVPPILRDAFNELDIKSANADWLGKFTGLAMKAKTVYSWQSLMRNFFGNMAIVSLNGNAFRGDSGKSISAAIGNFRKLSDTDKRKYIKRLTELGVISDNVGPEILRQLDQHGNLSGKDIENKFLDYIANHPEATKTGKAVGHGLNYAIKTAEGLYSGVDEIWKVYSYEAEKAKLEKALGVSGSSIEVRAANIVRRTMPTYSEAFRASTDLFRGPLGKIVAPFITFTTEIVRSTAGTVAQAREELKDNNPAIRKIGRERVHGIITTAALFIGATMLSKALSGIDDDDEEAVRRGLPEWQKNSQLLFVGKNSKGHPRFLDISYLNPYNYMTDPFVSLWRGEGAKGAGLELVKPFSGEQIFFGAMVNIMRNMKPNGTRLWNPAEGPGEMIKKSGEEIWKALQPGIYTSGERITKGLTGHVEESGKSYNPLIEFVAAATGQRVQEYDPEQTLGYQASRFSRDRRDASQIFNDKLTTKSDINPSEVASAYTRTNKAEKRAIENLHLDFEAAKQLGVDKKKAEAILKDRNAGKKAIDQAKSGVYKRYEPDTNTLFSYRNSKDAKLKARYNAYLSASGKAPKTEPLGKLK